ncbi:MAG TPA: ribosomal RNA small subunit methyltransferase A [Candidatus Korarchaeota archaeon]|nr:MAG: ribosomal RNA small subunit methyltransferase A [Candidatus Korarchaeota archaeon]HDD68920.1 ribosomal RNA small subunit methyltransferase A [Candidatus Korarchaeota archaeon]
MGGEYSTSNDLRRRALEFIRSRGFRSVKEHDQYFMVDRKELKSIVDVAEISKEDVVLEIGAGLGFLTEEIASKGPKAIYAVEKDPELASMLLERFKREPRIRVICEDVLKLLPFKGNYTKVVANPPFSISSRILLGLLDSEFKSASITFQYEFVERLTAEVGSRSYGSLTVLTWLKFDATVVKRIDRSSFIPKPDVDVVLIKIEPRKRGLMMDPMEWAFLKQMLPFLFERRKRKLRNALENFLTNSYRIRRAEAKRLARELVTTDIRVYRTSPLEFVELARNIRHSLLKPS